MDVVSSVTVEAWYWKRPSNRFVPLRPEITFEEAQLAARLLRERPADLNDRLVAFCPGDGMAAIRDGREITR